MGYCVFSAGGGGALSEETMTQKVTKLCVSQVTLAKVAKSWFLLSVKTVLASHLRRLEVNS